MLVCNAPSPCGEGDRGWGLNFMTEHGIVQNQRVSSTKVKLSRSLRREMTVAEKRFWEMVRGSKMFGLKFRRQQVIDGFIVDFYCDSLGLCVEIDGDIHDVEDQKEYDRLRSDVLELRKLKVLRFRNEEVMSDEESVRERIRELM